MSASDIRDPYANLTGSARRRAVLRARESIATTAKARRVSVSVAALIRANAAAIVAARGRVAS